MTPALQLCRTTIALLLQSGCNADLRSRLYAAIHLIELTPEQPTTAPAVLRALKCGLRRAMELNDRVLDAEIRRAIGALEDEMKGAGA